MDGSLVADQRSPEDEVTCDRVAGDLVSGTRTVLDRAASILSAFDDGKSVLTLGELSSRTGLPKSTAHRLAEQLCGLGWVEHDQVGYRVGMRLFELGGLAMQRGRLRDVALPHLYQLAAKSKLAVQLGILDGGDVVYLERIGAGVLDIPTRLGGRTPAYCTALGKAMLAFDPEATDRVVSAEMPRRTAHTITDPVRLQSELCHVRGVGYASDRGEAVDGLVCVSAPIRISGRTIGAVSVSGPAHRMMWNTTSADIRQTVDAIANAGARRVGWPA